MRTQEDKTMKEQIKRFADEAAAHGDLLGAAVAMAALGRDHSQIPLPADDRQAVNAMSEHEAFAKVADLLQAGDEMTYHIAYAREDGEFDIVRTFVAMHDHHAMQIAEDTMPGEDWYVLDEEKNNINAW